MALVMFVAGVGRRGYGDIYCLDGSSSLAGRSNCECGGKVGKRSLARFQHPDGGNYTCEQLRDYVANGGTGDVSQGVKQERTAGEEEKHRGNQSVSSKQLQQHRKGEQRLCAPGLVEIKGCDN